MTTIISIVIAVLCAFFLLLRVVEVNCDEEQNSSDRMYYPESNPTSLHLTPLVNTTKCANSTLCDDVFNYPIDRVMAAFHEENPQKYNRFLGQDKIDTDIANRFLDLDKTLCDSVVQLEEPKAGKNKDDQWMFIVNHGEYKQAVEITVCTDEKAACHMAENFPYRTECRQKYILRKMLALDPADGKLKEEIFKLPSCCSCVYFKKELRGT